MAATTWAGADPVALSWPGPLRAQLRSLAAADCRIGRELAAGRYLAALLVPLRASAAAMFGAEATGPAPFPVFAHHFERDLWEDSRDEHGRVRYCPDRDADRWMRGQLQALGLDPDLEPTATLHVEL